MSFFLWVLAGYLAGSCPTGYLVVRLFRGSDIRSFGSGNIGATNVGRLMGKKWAVGVAAFDMFKGGIVVLAARLCGADDTVQALSGLCAVLGHNFPLWLNFRGGKGVATTYGVVGFYDFFCPWAALLGGAVWFAVMKGTRYVSIASMAGLFAAACLTAAFGMPLPYTMAAFAMALLSVWRHRGNIQRIREGTELKVKS